VGRAISILALALALAVATGCRAQRVLQVTSDPPGASVRLDGEALGVTPLRHEFQYYGIRRITLRLEGYCTHSERIELRGPWYARFPLDIVTEVLVPMGWKDRRHFHVDLMPGDEVVAPPELRSVFERVEILRRAGPEGPIDLPPTRSRELPPLPGEPEETKDPPGSDGSGGGDRRP